MLTFTYADMKIIYGIFFMVAVCSVKVRTELSEDSVETRGILRDLLKDVISEVNEDISTTTAAGFFNIFDFGGSNTSSDITAAGETTTTSETTTATSGMFDFLSGFGGTKSSSLITSTSTTTADQSTTIISGVSTLFTGYKRLATTTTGWSWVNWMGYGRRNRRNPLPKLNLRKSQLPPVGSVQGGSSSAGSSTGSTRKTKSKSFNQDGLIQIKVQDTVIVQPLRKTGTTIDNVDAVPALEFINDENVHNVVVKQQETDRGRPSPSVDQQNETSLEKALHTDVASKTKSTNERPPVEKKYPQIKLPTSEVGNTTNNLTSEAAVIVSENDEMQERGLFDAVVGSLIDVLNKSITPASSTIKTSTTEPPDTFIRADGKRVPYPGDKVTADDSYTTPKRACNDGFVTTLLKHSRALLPSFIDNLFGTIYPTVHDC